MSNDITHEADTVDTLRPEPHEAIRFDVRLRLEEAIDLWDSNVDDATLAAHVAETLRMLLDGYPLMTAHQATYLREALENHGDRQTA